MRSRFLVSCPVSLSLLGGCLAACASHSPPPAAPTATAAAPQAPAAPVTVTSLSSEPEASPEPAEPSAFEVPRELDQRLEKRHRVASKLNNPRGMLSREGGVLLVSVAGTGDPDTPDTGGLLRLEDRNGDGDYDDEGERKSLLDKQPSKNILGIIQRDEVFGMADIEEGGGTVLATLAFFGGPSTVFSVTDQSVDRWATIHGNLNDIAYDEAHKQWFAVSSSSDEVLRISSDGRGDRVVKLPAMAQGQDPVPGYLRVEPEGGALLVSLFTGSTKGEAGGNGTDIVSRAGQIVRVDPDSGEVTPAVTGLTAPTDFWVSPEGVIYVLEFCDAFVEPINTREHLFDKPRHGGFRRFSGRLLRLDPEKGTAAVIANGLDAPTNLARQGDELLVAEGMGTPGRPIPGADGKPGKLEGFIEALAIR